MYERVFGKEDKSKCPDVDEQLAEVSDRILKKCAGVPLAIITIASLLASKGRNKLEWYDVCNSIGAGLEENNDVEDMRKVLSLGYYAMPSHLRTCLLYLSMFPEDYKIYKDRLIWLWIAEGFIQSSKQERSLFEIGEFYFNELVNRSMIQAKYDNYRGTVDSCRVYDMVLEFICSLSGEENFLTIWNHVDHSSASEKVRRLSLQNGKARHGIPKATMSTEHVSVVVFPPAIGHAPTLLTHLLRLRIDEETKVPKGIGSLTALEVLSDLGIHDDSCTYIIEELGYLKDLREVQINIMCTEWNEDLDKYLVESLNKLHKIQRLHIYFLSSGECNLDGWGVVIAPQHLCELYTHDCWFSTLPAWVNPTLLPDLLPRNPSEGAAAARPRNPREAPCSPPSKSRCVP